MSEVFISWSKDRSLAFAKALRQLMAQVLRDSARTFVPPLGPGSDLVSLSEDLPKGGNWFQNLAGLLEHARAGIICVTPENRSSPWLLFEAGALIRCDVEVALFPVLLDLPPASVDGPLALLQATLIERDPAAIKRETFALLHRITDHVNRLRQQGQIVGQIAVDPPPPDDPTEANSTDPDPWAVFAAQVLRIQPASVVSIFDRFPQLFERKTFQEPFQDCADQRWLDRYAGARIARAAMERHKPRMDAALPPGARLAYERLSSAVDSYAMAIAGQLLDERQFDRDHEGRLEDGEGRLAVCERRRQAIQAAYMRLRDPIAPVFDDARLYEELSGLEERKIRLIHPLEQRLDAQLAEGRSDPAVAHDWQLKRSATSPWLYDRLVFYLHAARAKGFPTSDDLLKGLERELSLLEAQDEPATLVGLYYALEAVEQRGIATADGMKLVELLGRIDARIDDWNRPAETPPPARDRVDANRKIRRRVKRLRELAERGDPGARIVAPPQASVDQVDDRS